MKNYKINSETLALCPVKNKTKVYEENKSFVVDEEISEIMEESCNYFGSSLAGRRKGTENLIGSKYKNPIIIEETKNIIFFPTESDRNESCAWIRSNKIDKYYNNGKDLILCFKNGSKIAIDKTAHIIEKQILKSSKLEAVLSERKNGK